MSTRGSRVRDFSGHGDAVLGLNVSRDGTKLVTGSADKTARIWNVADGKIARDAERATRGRSSVVSLADDASRVATGSADQSVRFWDAASGRELQRMLGPPRGDRRRRDPARQQVGRLGGGRQAGPGVGSGRRAGLRRSSGADPQRGRPSQRGPVFTASADKSIKVFDVKNGNVVRTLAGHTGAVKAVAVTKDGTKVISGSDDKTFRVWNVADGKPLLTTPTCPRALTAVAAASNNTLAAAGLADGTVKVYRPDHGRRGQGRAGELQERRAPR